MKEQVLSILKTNKDYVSGQELSDRLSVSRTAIWKAINALKEQGYEIDSVRNRGYRLIACPDVLFSEEIKSLLTTKWLGRKILFFDETDSTNNEIKRIADYNKEGILAIAEHQSAGKGRRGRTWESPAGSGIWMSFLLRPCVTPDKASQITLIAALAAAEAIRKVTGLEAYIKWPNDIVVNNKKIVGILTEMSTQIDYINYVVVGIGINVNTEEFPKDISAYASSLKIEGGKNVSRSRIVAELLESFEKHYETFCTDGNLSGIKDEYESMLINRGKDVIIIEKDTQIVRKALGIDQSGELLVQDEYGNITAVFSGEVSVRGLYGYV